MKPTCSIPSSPESGAAIIELVMVVPVFMIFIAGILDLSVLMKDSMAIDSAATAALRYCMDNPQESESSLKEGVADYLSIVSPELEDVNVAINLGKPVKDSYTHVIYTDESEHYITRDNSVCVYRPISVQLSYRSMYFTPIGRGISLAQGEGGDLVVASSKSGQLDLTGIEDW